MPVHPRGEDTATALRDWIKNDIKDAPNRIFEFGKFLFGVSSGSIGVFITVSKFAENAWDSRDWLALALFVASGLFALIVLMPAVHKLHSSYDLVIAHTKMVHRAWFFSILWGVCWVAAVGFAGYELLVHEPTPPPCIPI